MKKITWLLMILTLMAAGCGQREIGEASEQTTASVVTTLSEDVTETTKPQPPETTTSEVSAQPEDVEVQEVVDPLVESDVRAMEANNDLEAMWFYMDERMPDFNTLTGDYVIASFVTMAESLENETSDILYQDDYQIHSAIHDVYTEHSDEMAYGYLYAGSDKAVLLQYLDETFSQAIESIFNRGYGLISAEGSFYAVVDYIDLERMYVNNVSSMTSEFLGLMRETMIEQTTVEEYLAISPAELLERSLAFEKYLIDYPEAPYVYRRAVARQLYICLYKLGSPNPFDGTLTEEGLLTDEFAAVYEDALEMPESPLVYETAFMFTDWLQQRENDYVATYSDTEDLFALSGQINEKTSEMMGNLYGQ